MCPFFTDYEMYAFRCNGDPNYSCPCMNMEEYGNMTIKDSSGNSIYVYGVYGNDGTRYDGLGVHMPQVGDNIMLIGVLGTYNGSPQMKNANILSLQKQETPTINLNSLLSKYISTGKYTKTSNIYLITA